MNVRYLLIAAVCSPAFGSPYSILGRIGNALIYVPGLLWLGSLLGKGLGEGESDPYACLHPSAV